MRHLVREAGLEQAISVESAGTGSWHVGEDRDRRSRAVAKRRGMPLAGCAKTFAAADFHRLDLILALDTDNARDLRRRAPDDQAAEKIHLLREFDPAAPPGSSVPDPYYGGSRRLRGSLRYLSRGVPGPARLPAPDPWHLRPKCVEWPWRRRARR